MQIKMVIRVALIFLFGMMVQPLRLRGLGGQNKEVVAEFEEKEESEKGDVPDEWLVRKEAEEECTKQLCWSSENVLPICGSDNRTYLNPGVFLCILPCKPQLTVISFNRCSDMTTEKPEKTGDGKEDSDPKN